MATTVAQVARLGRMQDRVENVLRSHEHNYVVWLEKWDRAQREKFLSKHGPQKPSEENK